MNAFFIIPTNVKSAFGELFLTHPPLEKRLARLARDRARDGPPVVEAPVGLPRRPLRAEEAQGGLARAALRARRPRGHARGRARPEAGRQGGGRASSRSPRASSCGPRTSSQELLDVVAQSSGARVRRSTDSFGFEWLVFEDPDFEDLVTPSTSSARSCRRAASGRSCSPRSSASTDGSIPSTGSTGTSGARSGRSCRPARSRSATTPRSWS